MRDRTTLDEVRAALESPPPAPRMPATSGGSVGAVGDPAVAAAAVATTTPAADPTPDTVDSTATDDGTLSEASLTTRDAQVRNERMDRPETTDRGGMTAIANPESAPANRALAPTTTATSPTDSGPAGGTAGLSTADMAAAGTSATVDAAGTAARGSDGATVPATARPAGRTSDETPLFASDQASSLRTRWQDIQTGFVDEPRSAVQSADALVAEAMQQLAAMFADERRALEQQWSEGQQISTEDLRIALQRYRSFFNRLLSI